MNTLYDQFKDILTALNIPRPQELAVPESSLAEDIKKTKKKFKKLTIDTKDPDLSSALEKINKLLETLNKQYESTSKNNNEYTQVKEVRDQMFKEHQKALDEKKMLENLHANFIKKYDEELREARQFQAREVEKRNKTIEQLHARIKDIQQKFEESGKRKIDKFKDNEISKNELKRLESSLQANDALVEAQLKKKGFEIEIHISSLKQRIEMIEGFKNTGMDLPAMLEKSRSDTLKIQKKLKVLDVKEEENKIAIAKAHIIIEDYKKSMHGIKDILEKSEKESRQHKTKLLKSEDAMKSLNEEQSKLRKDLETQKNQLDGLERMERDLTEQLKNL